MEPDFRIVSLRTLFNNVDFPLPTWPIITINSPGLTSKSIFEIVWAASVFQAK